jgi:2-oxoglutarate ferredoxin oxidoreductase subunit gamma
MSSAMTSYKFAGFGGQGVLFIGKVLAQAGMIGKQQVTWIPAYGPEMRGGGRLTAPLLFQIKESVLLR